MAATQPKRVVVVPACERTAVVRTAWPSCDTLVDSLRHLLIPCCFLENSQAVGVKVSSVRKPFKTALPFRGTMTWIY